MSVFAQQVDRSDGEAGRVRDGARPAAIRGRATRFSVAAIAGVALAIFVADRTVLPVQLQGVTLYAVLALWIARLPAWRVAAGLVVGTIVLNGIDDVKEREDLWVALTSIVVLGLVGMLSISGVLRERAERARADENERLRVLLDEEHARWMQVQRERELLVTMVSHDLAQPLTHIGIDVALLQRLLSDLDDHEASAGLERIVRNTEQLTVLLQDLLDVAQGQAQALRVDPAPTPLAELVAEVVNALGDLTRTCSVVIDGAPALPAAMVDRHRTEQVLRNLLANAAKYAPAGSVIRVTIARRADALVVGIEDDGPGVPPALHIRVFEPFFRVPDDAPAGTSGRGLGLAVCRYLVEAQGGMIWCEPSASGGSRFGFTVPLAHEPG